MFTVTEAASAHLANMLAEAETPEDKNVVIRMSRSKDGLGLTLGPAGPEDTIFAHEGLAVLAIDEELRRRWPTTRLMWRRRRTVQPCSFVKSARVRRLIVTV